jgi:hypothetical protein
MWFSAMLRRVALVRTEVSEECNTYIIRVIVFLNSMHQLLVMANVVSSSLILVILMIEALCSSEMLVLIRATWHNIPEDDIP